MINTPQQEFWDGNVPAVSAVALSKRYGKVMAVTEAGFRIEQGDIFGLLGPNGAGKTTIIRMLLGLARPSSGQVEIFGLDPVGQRAKVLEKVSAIIEEPALYPFLSGQDNLRALALAADLKNPGPRIEEVLQKVGLASQAGKKFGSYSLGMKQRLSVAAALLTDPSLIILDEPTNGMDAAGMAEMRELIRNLAAAGKTVLISSHLLGEVQQVCNRVTVIQRGQVVVQGQVRELLAGKSQLQVAVAPEEQARAWHILVTKGLAEGLRLEGDRLVLEGSNISGNAVNRALAEEGIYAGEIVLRQQTLEEYYLALTGSAAVAAG